MHVEFDLSEIKFACAICRDLNGVREEWLTDRCPRVHRACAERIKEYTKVLFDALGSTKPSDETGSYAIYAGMDAVRSKVEKKYGDVALATLLDGGVKELQLQKWFIEVGKPVVARHVATMQARL